MKRAGVVSGATLLVLAAGVCLNGGDVLARLSTRRPSKVPDQRSEIVFADAALIYATSRTYSTATAVIPRMYGSATPDSVPGRYQYTYTLVNDQASTNTIWKFALDPVTTPLGVTPPPHWRWLFGYQLEDSALYFTSMPDGSIPSGWDSLSVVRSVYDLAPGDSLAFGFLSDRAPSMTKFYVQGYYRDSISTDTDAALEATSIWNNSVSGTVIGPATTTAVPEGRNPDGVPGAPLLRAPVPNPTGASATVAFNLPKAGRVLLGVYDVSGRLVQVLVECRLQILGFVAIFPGAFDLVV